MKPCALVIPCEGLFSETISRGYRDALVSMGWDVIHYRCPTKLEAIDFIENHGVRLILTQCRTGTRQLPVDAINANGVAVAIQALPFNSSHEPLGGRDAYVEPSDPEIVGSINRRALHTPCDYPTIDSHFHRWIEMDLPIIHLPLAGNLLRALPTSLEVTHDVAMVLDLAEKPWVLPLLARLRECSFSFYGDHGWESMGAKEVRPTREAYAKLAEIYGRATVSVNLHSPWERGVVLNEQAYMIQLCGGFQITDNPLAAEMFGPYAVVASNPTEMIQAAERAIKHPEPSVRAESMLNQVQHAMALHTYHDRLAGIFRVLAMNDYADQAEIVQGRIAQQHIRGMTALMEEVGA